MIDAQEYIRRLNAADPAELAAMLVRPTADEERVLVAHLGRERLDRMQALASDAVTSRRPTAKRGNVVVIHGILGAELSSTPRAGGIVEKIWLDYFQLFLGRFHRFRLNDAGDADVDPHVTVGASGMLMRYYGEIILLLQRDWNVLKFWFDWRKDLRVSAAQLAAKTASELGADAPFHIVAHSMGGLVARSFIAGNRERWKKGGGRLIMLGTPNYGSFVVPQIITGLEGIIRKIALIDRHNSVADIAEIANSFPGSYQLLPSPEKLPALEPLYDAATWGRFKGVRQTHLTSARKFQAEIAEAPAERFVYIAGYGHDTLANITDLARVGEASAYTSTKAGDGRVPHQLGLLDGVPAYYVPAVHAELPMDARVQRAMNDLLESGACDLPHEPPPAVRGEAERVAADLPDPDEAELAAIAAQTQGARGASRSAQQEQELATRAEEILVRGWLSAGATQRTAAVEPAAKPPAEEVPEIEIDVQVASIADVDADVIGGGVYIGVRPDGAVSILDDEITTSYRGRTPKSEERLITQMLERGVIHGGLGQPFLLPDPRSPKRLIAIVGMGAPGRFGVPECTVLARELAWTLGKIKREHLATVLIGSGAGNLRTTDAVQAWLRGVARALPGTPADERLRRITFIDVDAEKVLYIDEAVRAAQGDLAGKLNVKYAGLADRAATEKQAVAAKQEAMEKEFARMRIGTEAQRMDVPARMTVTFDVDRGAYLFGAITSTAAVPEREIPLDRRLVEEASQRIANQTALDAQLSTGEFLRKLLVPRDFRDQLQGPEPLVVLVDRITARTPWEMVVRGELDPAQRADSGRDAFLGIARGLTRQLRTTFAPPPEPPPPIQPVLRVLLVADPAADMPLPGAQREGMELRALFESAGGRVEVTPLLGPSRATRYAVLEAVMQGDFDVLHFAGHCTFNADDPSKSGWIFGRDDFLSANELNRIDRIPRFVFSNACESGVTPDNANLSLGPSFAEAFFLRGVTNFVCTAWPVNDTAALEFARALYTSLLGGSFMHVAMQQARLAISGKSFGAGTWGAYQHYGNPYYRLV